MSVTRLAFENVTKEFPGVRALDAVSFTVEGGRIHAFMGENGAGKSTLLKILSGAYSPTSGTLAINGERRVFSSTAEAIAAQVAVIYQELNLVPEMSVAENLFLGHLPVQSGQVNRRQLHAMTREHLAWVGEEIDPDTKVGRLPIAQRQLIEIAKALTRKPRVIAFDEPTSSLSSREINRLFAVIRELRTQGHAILYVTHRMEEVFALCDAITVLRDGKHVRTYESLEGVTVDQIVHHMVGRDLKDVYHYAPRPHGDTALEIAGMCGPGVKQPVSLRVAKGEILGIFGLVGAGRSELFRLIYGAEPRTAGTIQIVGRPVTIHSPRDAIAAGLVFCPEDRKKDGIIPIRSVLENINLSARRNHLTAGFVLDRAWEHSNAAAQVKALGVRTASLDTEIVYLSGGNQQKAILARWLSETVQVILLDEPTRGIDIGAKSEIYTLIQRLARDGVGVIFISSDLPEVLGLSDRITVMRGGALVATFLRGEANETNVLKAALPATS